MARKDDFIAVSIKTYYDLSEKYEIIDRIGRGSFSEVFLTNDTLTKEEKAIKVVKIDVLKGITKSNIDFIKEASILQTLNHPNIVKFYECFEYLDYICMVCEYCDGGELANLLNRNSHKNTYITNDVTIEWYYKLSSALDYLHDNKIMHRDIKSQNIYLKNKCREIKLGDFGESRYFMNTLKLRTLTAMVGTLPNMPPEMYLNGKYNFSADVWSLGCVFYEIRYLDQPFNGGTFDELKKNILNCELPLLKETKDEIDDLIRNMLCKDINERLTIKKVLNYKMFDRYRNKQINEKDEKVTHNQNKMEDKYQNEWVLKVDNENEINEMKKLTIKQKNTKLQEGIKNEDKKQIKFDKLGKEVKISDSSYIMISYCHEDKEICLKINRDLKKNGFKTWIDVETSFNNVIDAMAEAVEKAFIVLVCYSQYYQKSKSCKVEATYANELKKNIIAIKLQNYTPREWLGLLIAGKLYIDFSPGKNYFSSFKNLLKQSNFFYKNFQSSDNKNLQIKSAAAVGDVSDHPTDWNSQKVEEWLTTNNLENIAKVFKDYDGAALEELRKIKREHVSMFYDLIENEIKETNVRVGTLEKLRFYNYLEKLFK